MDYKCLREATETSENIYKKEIDFINYKSFILDMN